jgi:hypothetical protein
MQTKTLLGVYDKKLSAAMMLMSKINKTKVVPQIFI